MSDITKCCDEQNPTPMGIQKSCENIIDVSAIQIFPFILKNRLEIELKILLLDYCSLKAGVANFRLFEIDHKIS